MAENFSLSPTDRSPRPSPFDYLIRAGVCHVRAAVEQSEPLRVARALYAGDPVVPILLGSKAASTQATTGSSAWAGVVAAQGVSSLLQAIVSLSAGASLLVRAMRIKLGDFASVRVPGRITAPGAAVWVGEGGAIPLKNFTSNSALLTPHKIACVTSYSNELARSSNVENVLRSLLSEAAAIAIDAALFPSSADDGIVPGGLRAGVAPIAAAPAGSRWDCASQDVENLVAALASSYGGLDPTFIAAPGQAAALKFFAGQGFDFPVLPSAALPAGTVICVEASSLAATITDAIPEFNVSKAVLLHFEDASPAGDLMTGAPVRSAFQIDATALRMIIKDIDWKLRAAGHVQWTQGVNW